MEKINQKPFVAFLAVLGIFLGSFGAAHAVSTFITSQGGTGTTTPSGILYGDNGATNHINTVTIGTGLQFSGGTLSNTGATFSYPFPNNATTTTLIFNNGIISTASSTFSNLGTGAAYTQNGLLLSDATSSASVPYQDIWRDGNGNALATNFIPGLTITTASGGTNVLTPASTRYQFLNGSNNQTYQMANGNASGMNSGATWDFNNNTTDGFSMNVTTHGGAPIVTVPYGGFSRVILTDNGTSEGSWETHSFLGHNDVAGTYVAGFGSTTPYSRFSIHANNGDTKKTLFAIGSSTATATTTLFSVNNFGLTHIGTNCTTPNGGGGNMGNVQGLEVCGSDNTINGVEAGVTNINNGPSAYSALYLNNDQANTAFTHFGAITLNSSTYNDTTFGTAFAVPNQLGIQNTDGPISNIVSTTTASLEYQNWLLGGTNTNNELMRLTPTGLGIGTTTPHWNLQVAGTRPFFTLSDTAAGANLKHWIFSAQGGSFYLASSSDAYATSSLAALAVDSNSNVTLRGSVINLLGLTNGVVRISGQNGTVSTYLEIGTVSSGNLQPYIKSRSGRGLDVGGNNSAELQFDATGRYITTPTTQYVGLGTTTPFSQLQIASSSTSASFKSQLVLTDNSAGANLKHFGMTYASGLLSLGSINDTYATTSALNITSGGNVGVGTTSPFSLFGINAPGGTSPFAIGSTTSTLLQVLASGKLFVKDIVNGWFGVVSPTKTLVMSAATSTATWTASSTPGVDASATTTLPFAGTVNQLLCNSNSFLGVQVLINSTVISPTYFIASSTVGTVNVTANNTFNKGDKLSVNFGTTTSATAGAPVTASCSILTTESQ